MTQLLTITNIAYFSFQFYDADIIVFPEGTLTPDYSSSVPVPEPENKIIPHKHKYYNKYDVCPYATTAERTNRKKEISITLYSNYEFQVLSVISKAAAKEKVYVVTNLYERIECGQDQQQECPPIGFLNSNTDVVFDRNGTVIAKYALLVGAPRRRVSLRQQVDSTIFSYRYRKTYKKSYMDKPEKADLVTFTTDFGVTYGVFTGFDILFKTPAIDLVRQMNVTHFVHPSRWHGDLPFLTCKSTTFRLLSGLRSNVYTPFSRSSAFRMELRLERYSARFRSQQDENR